MLQLILLILSVAIGYIFGGRLKGILKMDIKWLWLPVIAYAMDAALEPVARKAAFFWDYAWIFVLLQYLLLFAFVARNIKSPPFWPLCAGTAANFLVISLNGFKMPVAAAIFDVNSAAAAETARRLADGEILRYTLANADTKLAFLGDIIKIPGVGGFASIGDLLLAGGLAWLIIAGMCMAKETGAETE